jgi:hypothetical protein
MPDMMPLLITLVSLTVLQTPAAGALRFTAPPEWTSRPAASAMRVAEYVLPKAAGDPEDGELIVYFFGGTGGSVDANIERWLGQMQQPDGRASRDVATRATRTVNGLSVTTLDLAGTYVAEVRPGSSERHNKPGFWMRAAVVTTPRGPYFVKAVGPAKTMTRWKDALDAFMNSVRVDK